MSSKHKHAGFIVIYLGEIYSTGSSRKRAIAAYNKFAAGTDGEFRLCAADGSTDDFEVSHATQNLLDEYAESHGNTTQYTHVYDERFDDDYIACTKAEAAAANPFYGMATIDVKYTIQSALLENYYADYEAAARQLASLMDDTWEADMNPFKSEGHDVWVRIGVIDKTIGSERNEPDVTISAIKKHEPLSVMAELALENRVRSALTDQLEIRQTYLNDVQPTA